MPCYLVHGFRWPRRAIRIHIIMENIEEAAAEYLIAPNTSAAVLKNLKTKFPDEMKLIPKLRFVEQYDPSDTSARALSQPFAFVVDKVKTIDLSLNVSDSIEEIGATISEKQMAAMEKIKEILAPDESVGWYVVYNGDESRALAGDDVPMSRTLRTKKSLKKLFNRT